MQVFDNYIAGERVAPAGGERFASVNPTTGKVWGEFAESGRADVDRAVRAAQAAFQGPWSKLSPTRRGRLLMAWGDRIAEHAEPIAAMETQQNGKLIAEMRAQARVVKDFLYYFGGLADKVEGRVIPLDRQSVLNYTLREPLGVVGVIVPWNSPTFLTIMNVAPALAAGNTIVIKPSEVTSGSAFELARLAEDAGIAPGVINVVTGGRAAGEALVEHAGVAKISFTGSEAGGKAIAAKAGSRLAGCTLELGGKSPNIVFGDADLDQAEAGVLAGIFAAAGQTCVAGSRALVHESVYDEMQRRLVARAQRIKLGDPLLAETQMGPVATRAQLAKDEQMVQRALSAGAELLCGGERARVSGFEEGFFYKPTILHRAPAESEIMREEVFGPVLPIFRFADLDEAIRRANDTPYGLGSSIWTHDVRKIHRAAKEIDAGMTWVNQIHYGYDELPFGGVKDSGSGKEHGLEAMDSYVELKSVVVGGLA